MLLRFCTTEEGRGRGKGRKWSSLSHDGNKSAGRSPTLIPLICNRMFKVYMTNLLNEIFMVFEEKKENKKIEKTFFRYRFFFCVFSPSKNVKFHFRWGTIPRKKKDLE